MIQLLQQMCKNSNLNTLFEIGTGKTLDFYGK